MGGPYAPELLRGAALMGVREPDAGDHSVHTYGVLYRFVGPRTGIVAGVVVGWVEVRRSDGRAKKVGVGVSMKL
jgi:hypothetical protein